MSKAGFFQRYLSIIRIIKSKEYVSMSDLLIELERELLFYGDTGNMGLSERTIRRDFDDIGDIFQIEIIYSRAKNGYYIGENDSSFVEKKLEQLDLLGTLDKGLEDIVFLEKRRFKGTEYINPLIAAIKSSRIVEFRYRKFDNTVTKERRVVEPYALKEFKNRWYLLAVEQGGRLEEVGEIKTWGLDRIEHFHLTDRFFNKNERINIEDEFKNSFGIYSDEDKEAEEVILSFTPMGGRYNDALPLHHSQEILIDNEEEFRIQLKVKITYDFVMELLSQSETMRVIAPIHLRDKMIAIYENAIKNFKSKR